MSQDIDSIPVRAYDGALATAGQLSAVTPRDEETGEEIDNTVALTVEQGDDATTILADQDKLRQLVCE